MCETNYKLLTYTWSKSQLCCTIQLLCLVKVQEQQLQTSLCMNAKRFVVYVTGPASLPQSSLSLEAET